MPHSKLGVLLMICDAELFIAGTQRVFIAMTECLPVSPSASACW